MKIITLIFIATIGCNNIKTNKYYYKENYVEEYKESDTIYMTFLNRKGLGKQINDTIYSVDSGLTWHFINKTHP